MSKAQEQIPSGYFTQHRDPYAEIRWSLRHVKGLSFPVEAPDFWSDTAVEIAAHKFFRRGETSVRELFKRVTETIAQAGVKQNYFTIEQGAVFAQELSHLLLQQMGSFNSPVYFNVGIFPAPQSSACFIQSVEDDLSSIFDLLKTEAKLFKFGSGTGTNFSNLRAKGEALESGGSSSGLLAYLEIFDKAAQAIKSGGTNRRAAKMVVLDADHPEILDFINWKKKEERKARVLLANGYSGGMEGEALKTVSGQNSNNSVRLSDEFLRRVQSGQTWDLKARTSGQTQEQLMAKDLFSEIAAAAWECADPGVHFSDTIQRWHMCPKAGEIRSSNPCSEYLFLDNSACNLASLNLVKFLQPETSQFKWKDFQEAISLLLTAQDILVELSSYPSEAIKLNSHQFRPLGLGYANLGGFLTRMALPYGSLKAQEWTKLITAALHGFALKTSTYWAEKKSPFGEWSQHSPDALRVLSHHAKALELIESVPEFLRALYQEVQNSVRQFGLRNAQVTLLAPTGTIGLLMDCDTLGIEPDFALIKIKSLAGGGELRLVNASVEPALNKLGYSQEAIKEILAHIQQHNTPLGAKAFNTLHGPIFDCAINPAQFPERRITPMDHLNIMASAQPFLSGAISKTVNLPAQATKQDISDLMLRAWQMGLKAVAFYRDGSKSAQPLCAEC